MGTSLTEWYYPGGYVQDVGNHPREDEDELGWELLFLFNPDGRRPARATVRVYYEDAPPREFERVVEPWEKLRTALHRAPWREYVGTNRAFGLRLSSDRPLFPHVTRAEVESWDEHNPTAMYGIVPYQGPLADERRWWYAGGFWQDSEAHPWLEQEWIHVLNPGPTPGDLTVTFYLGDSHQVHTRRVDAERVALVRVERLGLVPSGVHYGVRVDCTVPVVVQQARRTLEKGGAAWSRSTTASLAVPFGGPPGEPGPGG
jgi:hypothetical protein